MSVIVAAFVKNGVVVPNSPLPEGAFVEVHVVHGPSEVPPEKQWPCQAGSYRKAEFWMAADFDAPLDEFKEYME